MVSVLDGTRPTCLRMKKRVIIVTAAAIVSAIALVCVILLVPYGSIFREPITVWAERTDVYHGVGYVLTPSKNATWDHWRLMIRYPIEATAGLTPKTAGWALDADAFANGGRFVDLGTIGIWHSSLECIVMDYSGNGMMNQGDRLFITGTPGTYYFAIIDIPSGEVSFEDTFTILSI